MSLTLIVIVALGYWLGTLAANAAVALVEWMQGDES
jgi:hypothetical protein